MRIFRGLENIHSVIDRHEAEWRKDNGEEPETPRKVSLEETVRRRLTSQPKEGSGRFAADRFLGGKAEPVKHKEEKPVIPEPEPEILEEPETVGNEPEVMAKPEQVNAESEAEDKAETPKRAETGLTGWIDCYPKSRLAGTLFCGGVNEAREIEGNPKLQEAYELGKSIG